MTRKKIFFAVNTLSKAGAEMAALELTKRLIRRYDIDLLIMTGMGEMLGEVPKGVRLLNKMGPSPFYSSESVLEEG